MLTFLPIQTSDGSYSLKDPETDETYHSLTGALSEATALYMEASGFKEHLTKQQASGTLRVLDVGLGLGYNALCGIETFLNSSSFLNKTNRLFLVSLETNKSLFEAFLTTKAPWQKDWPDTWLHLIAALEKKDEDHWLLEREGLCWSIHLKDYSQIENHLPASGLHFIWHDPFSPKKLPHLWSKQWFETLHRASAPGAILATYSVARSVRVALEESSWEIKKIPASGKKRSWLLATSQSPGF